MANPAGLTPGEMRAREQATHLSRAQQEATRNSLPRNRGLFVVFEGIDGAGKSTLSHSVAQKLEIKGWESVQLREPTHHGPGKKLRELLAGRAGAPPEDPEEEIKLFIADREQDLRENILPALRQNKIVLLDRYLYSSAAYQARGKISSLEILERNYQAGFPLPHLLFYIHLPPHISMERIGRSRQSRDIFETQEQLAKIGRNYEVVLPPEHIRLDGREKPEKLRDEVLREISARWRRSHTGH